MTRSRTLRCWAVGLWGLVLVAAATGQLGATSHPVADDAPPAAVAVLAAATDAAFLPGRIAAEVRGAAQGGLPRTPFVPAVLATLLGLPALLRRATFAAGADRRPLLARRHAIALRAPPLLQLD